MIRLARPAPSAAVAIAPVNPRLTGTGATPLLERLRAERAWGILAAATVGMALGFGVVSSFSVFMAPLEREFGWSRADVSSAYTLMTVGMAVGGLAWGALADTRHLRKVLVFGALAIGMGLILAGRQESLLGFRVVSLALGLVGFACLYTPLIAAVGLWFERNRGLAIGIVTAGGALGQGVVPLAADGLIAALGWRDAYLAMGLGYLAVLTPAMMVIGRPIVRAAATSAGAPGAARGGLSVRAGTIWLSTAGFLCCTCMAVPLVHLVTLVCHHGHAPSAGAGLLFAIMAVGAASRVLFGLAADRIGALRSYMVASAVQTASVFWFVSSDHLAVLVPLSLIFGFGFAGNMTSLMLTIRETVPQQVLGRVTGLVALVAWLGMGAGGYAGGLLYDWTGSYVGSFALAAAAGGGNLVVLALFARAARRPLFEPGGCNPVRGRSTRDARRPAESSLGRPSRP